MNVLIGAGSDDSLEFTDAIAEDWGGKPFIDLINGWKYVLKSYPEVRYNVIDVWTPGRISYLDWCWPSGRRWCELGWIRHQVSL